LPTPLPFVFNTPSPFFGTGGGSGGTGGGPAGTPTPIPTTSDLDIQSVRVLADGRVNVVVLNRGPAPITNQIVQVTVRALGLAGETMVHTGLFPSGESITFRTDGFRVTSPTEIQVIVDAGANINDPSRTNNVETQLLSPQPTPEQAASPTPGFG
jgi:hypothetical protein